MIKTVELTGKELMVNGLNGFNTTVENLGDDVIYASKYPNITAGADNVAEIPVGSSKVISATNGTVYLLGNGKAELTGQDHEYVSSSGNSSAAGVSKAYVDKTIAENADILKAYADDAVSSVNSSIMSLQSEKADKSEIPTELPANGGNAATVNGHTVKKDVPANAVFTDTIVDISGKMDVSNPTGRGSFSLNSDPIQVLGKYAVAVGEVTGANGRAAFAEGGSTAIDRSNTKLVRPTSASADYSHAEGCGSQAAAAYSHAEGYGTIAGGVQSHAEGRYSETAAFNSHAEGNITFATGVSAHSEGAYSTAEGLASHAQGYASYAKGRYSFTSGVGTVSANNYDTVLGKLNDNSKNSLLTIGYGSGGKVDCNYHINKTASEFNEYVRTGATLTNKFRVDTTGAVYGVGAFKTTGADYAEYIKPWFDNNAENEDRRGYFVTIKDGLLHKAEPSDYIVGITSGNPSVVGNGDEDWLGRWQRDEFNELIYEDIEVDDFEEHVGENGDVVVVKVGSHVERHTVQNSDYDPSQPYIERKERPEWSYVGMVGVLPLRDDGSCAAGGFARCGAGGVATKADSWECHKTFFVLERINDHIISVEMR